MTAQPAAIVPAIAKIAAKTAAGWAVKVYDSAPPLSSLKPVQKGRSSAIYAADGSLIGFIRSSNIRQPVPSSALPSDLKEATIAIEDKNFYHHGGVDPAGILRAAWKDLLAGGKPVQGASTITQQLVRNLYIQDPEETIKRKLIEAHLAEDEEDAHSKDWILTQYLNTAPYGTVEGETAVGAQAAAETYYETFGRTWERQAWLRARPAAGDRALGDELLSVLEPFIYPRSIDARLIDDVRGLRALFRDPADAGGALGETGFDVKLGAGGIRDVEMVATRRPSHRWSGSLHEELRRFVLQGA